MWNWSKVSGWRIASFYFFFVWVRKKRVKRIDSAVQYVIHRHGGVFGRHASRVCKSFNEASNTNLKNAIFDSSWLSCTSPNIWCDFFVELSRRICTNYFVWNIRLYSMPWYSEYLLKHSPVNRSNRECEMSNQTDSVAHVAFLRINISCVTSRYSFFNGVICG